MIGRHDADERIGPVRQDEHGADDPAPILAEPGCCEAKRRRHDSKSGLHRIAGVVAGLPLLEQVLVVEAEAGRVLRERCAAYYSVLMERCEHATPGGNIFAIRGLSLRQSHLEKAPVAAKCDVGSG